MIKIFIDAGHGGVDPGATYRDRLEKNDTLEIANLIADELKRHNITVILSRKDDVTVQLQERVNLANSNNADYFISIHRNAYVPEQSQGVETYIFENASIKSRQLAQKVQRGLVELGFRNRGVKTANFYVLRQTKMPAILIEIGFIDNSQDNKLFDSKKDEIVKSIVMSILDQVGIQYKEKYVFENANVKKWYIE
ncbi:N-acetylmuramoyl-L-alanine amidase [Alkalithermobacter thermoalcaliphilus JW-YL-7 = DSM 7308]|uniref:Cell wall hydrolase/autolysin n=1 Tax=Alkalithermobacter thermoalcaliphilus JW-YL-7 = DSM 7308 TaxID=1121328 RepID=A0A150FPX4_CLOPD|nr:cell wall hydrolase/autolysin [[Clostridium] paradoxum JW-YL-7 = DSM 7308]SHK65222.1 N-acetylmuramoyl-L-alanine amidase [[Clostridium] paradoxum JW-YL-7 = DSM 7308]